MRTNQSLASWNGEAPSWDKLAVRFEPASWSPRHKRYQLRHCYASEDTWPNRNPAISFDYINDVSQHGWLLSGVNNWEQALHPAPGSRRQVRISGVWSVYKSRTPPTGWLITGDIQRSLGSPANDRVNIVIGDGPTGSRYSRNDIWPSPALSRVCRHVGICKQSVSYRSGANENIKRRYAKAWDRRHPGHETRRAAISWIGHKDEDKADASGDGETARTWSRILAVCHRDIRTGWVM